MNILYVLDRYLELHYERKNFKSCFNVNLIKVKELISDSMIINNEVIIFTEFIIVLTSLSINRELFLDRIENLTEEIISQYLEVIDTYINQEDNNFIDTSINKGNKKYSILKIVHDRRRNTNLTLNNSMLKDTSQSNLFYFGNGNFDNENNNEIKLMNIKLTNDLKEAYLRIKELQNTVDMLKKDEEQLKIQDREHAKLIEEINSLRHTIDTKNIEISELNKKVIIGGKKYLDEISDLKEKLENSKMTENDLRSSLKEGEKFKNKLKELSIVKQKAEEYDNLKSLFDTLVSEHELIKKEKLNMNHKIEVSKAEILNLNEKLKQSEASNVNLQIELSNLNREIYLEDKRRKLKSNSGLAYNLESVIENENEKNENALPNEERDIVLENVQKRTSLGKQENTINNDHLNDSYIELEKENFELKLKIEKMKSHVKSTKTIHEHAKQLIEEDNKIFDKIQEKEKEIQKLILLLKDEQENKKILKEEAEQLRNEVKNLELENKKAETKMLHFKKEDVERQDKKVKTINELESKINIINLEKKTIEKENFELRNQISNNNSLINKMLDEKMILIENESRSRETLHNEKIKSETEFKLKIKSLEEELEKQGGLIKENTQLSVKLDGLSRDIEMLKEKIKIKELKIVELNDEIKVKEEKLRELLIQIKENNDVFNEELEKRQGDINFYKKLNEDQQNKFIKENDLVLNNLYELALQFNNLKNEYDKKCFAFNGKNIK